MLSSAALEIKLAKLEREHELLRLKNEALTAELADLKRRMFGPKSEKIDPGQFMLAIEAEVQNGVLEEEEPAKEVARSPRKGGGRRPAPQNLPVER